jgi:hypothetical protein
VVLAGADNIVSVELFSFAKQVIEQGGKRIVLAGSPRTFADARVARLGVGLSARDLSVWMIDHAHPWTWHHLFGQGRGSVPSGVYFRDDNGISYHAFRLMPLLVVKDGRPLDFATTSDSTLFECFTEDEIYVVGNREIAVCDVSPDWRKPWLGDEIMSVASIAAWAKRNATARQRWLFSHRIVVTGDGADSQPIVDEILRAAA